MKRLVRRLRRERGQVLVIAALLLPVLLAMVGMAVDVGTYASDRRALQNAADAMALAGGQELPDSAAATSAALSLADDHGVNTGDVTVTITGGSTTPAIRVTIARNHDFSFMQIVGIDSRSVGATAKANLYSMGAGAGIVPWSITQNTVDGSVPGADVILKYDSSGTDYGEGNFGAIRIDGSGSSDYESSVKYGATHEICSTATPNCTSGGCPGSYPSTCGENSSECDGPDCSPKTGNMTGPTRDAVDFRMNNTSTACDDFDEIFTPISSASDLKFRFERQLAEYAGSSNTAGGRLLAPLGPPPPSHTPRPTDTPTQTNTPVPTNTVFSTSTPAPTHTPMPTNTTGPSATPTTAPPTATPVSGGGSDTQYTINPNCNPWSGGKCTSNTDSNCSRRVFLIPIINDFGNGSSDPTTILGFALVFLEGYDSGRCSGNSCEIHARFVNAKVDTSGYASTYDEDSSIHIVRLTE
jgi:Flp pilus assembly protein TadG